MAQITLTTTNTELLADLLEIANTIKEYDPETGEEIESTLTDLQKVTRWIKTLVVNRVNALRKNKAKALAVSTDVSEDDLT